MPKLNKMNQDQLIEWINGLSSIKADDKTKIIDGIKQFAKENDDPVTGSDFFKADAEDIEEFASYAISKKVAKSILKEVTKQKDQDCSSSVGSIIKSNADTNNKTNNGKFTLNLVAQQGGLVPMKNVSKEWTIADVKQTYLREQGDDAAANEYAMKHKKWEKTKEKIEIAKGKTVMQNDRTLESYGITRTFDTKLPLVILYKCRGGAEAKHDGGDEDQYRVRKLRRGKYKGMIKKSSKPDCIMGYTDADGIRRAEMPCGCAIAADTMWRYMKALFEKDLKSAKLFCPTPKKLCSGSDQQREWPWNLIYIIADLSDQEIQKYSRIITNRTAGTKNCPHCGATTERPQELRICRVACNQCSGRDWCWNCTKVWNSSGLGPICGNQGCMGAQINNILEDCEWIVPEWHDIVKSSLTAGGDKNGKVPRIRACPKCCSMIQYTAACKHMWCLCCPQEFCFNCLGLWKKDGAAGDGECNHGKSCNLYKSNDGKYRQVFT